MKKLLCLMFACLFISGVVPPSYAFDVTSEQEPIELPAYIIDGQNMTQEEIDREVEEHINSLVDSLNNKSRVQTYYKSMSLPAIPRTVSGYPGNQTSVGGYRFPTGGAFYYSEDGGPETTVSVAVSLPFGLSPYGISVGIGLGNRSDSFGLIVNVPDTVNYYKLYVKKEVEVRPVAIFEVDSKNGPITEDSRLAYVTESVVIIKTDPYAVRV